MNIYKLSQEEKKDYDTYDSIIVCAENSEDAKNITPDNKIFNGRCSRWCSSKDFIKCELIGFSIPGLKRGVVLSSYNAG